MLETNQNFYYDFPEKNPINPKNNSKNKHKVHN